MNQKPRKNRPLLYYWVGAIIIYFIFSYVFSPISSQDGAKEVSYSQFVEDLPNWSLGRYRPYKKVACGSRTQQ